MNNIQIETAQNVIIEQTPANVGERIGAYLIDAIILLFYYILIAFLFGAIGSISEKAGMILFIIMLLPIIFYHLLCEVFMNGQSFGKKAVNIKVTKIDGTEPSFGNYLIRWLFRIIDNFFYGIPAIITISANGKGQRIGDIVAKTCVIKQNNKQTLKQTVFVNTEEDYEPVYPEVEKLTDKDINTIKEVLAHYKKAPGNAISSSMVRQTFDAVKKKIGAEPKEVPAVFLETILKDYNFIHKKS